MKTTIENLLDKANITLNTGEVVSLQQYTKSCSEYLINRLNEFDDQYSNLLKETLISNLGKKWSVVRKAIIDMESKINFNEIEYEHDLSMAMMYEDIIHPATDQDEEIMKWLDQQQLN
ncbi:hypothetical protein [Formosa haliotis]|uniref:hypothetical protein n=1 Tax=Formosa haliotis TaxID=1555194 RepID=UPI0008250343|nr:hypothetical protein [Formosa haliotis]